MKGPLARSPRGLIGPQRYLDHIEGVVTGASQRAEEAGRYAETRADRLIAIVQAAAAYHDLGKLDEANQEVLALESREKLPLGHEDAGVEALLQLGRTESAILVACHHAGLFSKRAERQKQGRIFRNLRESDEGRVADLVDERLPTYLEIHSAAGCPVIDGHPDGKLSDDGFERRVALSCLVDADHSDSARHTTGMARSSRSRTRPAPRWTERRQALDQYVDALTEGSRKSGKGHRTALRQQLYSACRGADSHPSIRSCEAPVGSGKTTAVMAHLLKVAEERELRHIFVVLPYTNIIRQSVKVYRDALVLSGESPEEIVAEHHHQADFANDQLRDLATLWRAPIIVTTAVQFFETLAASRTARLRKLHELPGSAVFLDEAHAAIPSHMWMQCWRWIDTWTRDWSGHLVLGSGSLARFWILPEFIDAAEIGTVTVPDLAPEALRQDLVRAETRRITLRQRNEALSLPDLISFIDSEPGPRLVILNTIQSAAVLAATMRDEGHDVLHLSTALAPVHRDAIVDRIEQRLEATWKGDYDPDWTLVATSCVEAGMNFSFRSGFREEASVASAIQVSGRVNRGASLDEAEVWIFRCDDPLLSGNPAMAIPSRVLSWLFDQDLVATLPPSDLTTEAFKRELTEGQLENGRRIVELEAGMEYPRVATECQVIKDETDAVLIDLNIVERLRRHEQLDRLEVLRHSVRIRRQVIDERGLEPVFPVRSDERPELWSWGAGLYSDEFLGYMDDLLPLIRGIHDGFLGTD